MKKLLYATLLSFAIFQEQKNCSLSTKIAKKTVAPFLAALGVGSYSLHCYVSNQELMKSRNKQDATMLKVKDLREKLKDIYDAELRNLTYYSQKKGGAEQECSEQERNNYRLYGAWFYQDFLKEFRVCCLSKNPSLFYLQDIVYYQFRLQKKILEEIFSERLQYCGLKEEKVALYLLERDLKLPNDVLLKEDIRKMLEKIRKKIDEIDKKIVSEKELDSEDDIFNIVVSLREAALDVILLLDEAYPPKSFLSYTVEQFLYLFTVSHRMSKSFVTYLSEITFK